MDAGRKPEKITSKLTKRLDRGRLLRSSGSDPRIHDCTFSVLDVETTGTGVNDQVIEIGLVRFTADGQAFDEWGTLINPGRDLQAHGVHRLGRFAYVRHAPSFEDVAGDLIQRLTGTVVVGHNLSFDQRMITQEFERLGVELPAPPSICTLRLGLTLGVPFRRLDDCCRQFGLGGELGHTALADARACSRLLALYLVTLQSTGVRTLRDMGCDVEVPPASAWPSLAPSGLSYLREAHDGKPKTYLAKLVTRLPTSGTESEIEYLSLLDHALEDFVLTHQEVAELSRFASSALTPVQIQDLHERYVKDLAVAAWSDGVVTREESNEIGLVANLLGVPYLKVEALLRQAQEESTGSSE